MHDLDTIKRLNRNPSANRQDKRFGRDKPAPQPTRAKSLGYDVMASYRLHQFRHNMQSPAMDREPLCE